MGGTAEARGPDDLQDWREQLCLVLVGASGILHLVGSTIYVLGTLLAARLEREREHRSLDAVQQGGRSRDTSRGRRASSRGGRS